MNRTQIIDLVKEVVALANTKLGVKMKMPAVEFYSVGVSAGWAFRAEHRLRFNEVLAAHNPKSFGDVIKHEVGHLVTYKMYPNATPHGKEFVAVTRAIGGSGERLHKMDTSVSRRKVKRHVAKCDCQTHHVSTRIANQIERRHCLTCKSPLVLTGKFKMK